MTRVLLSILILGFFTTSVVHAHTSAPEISPAALVFRRLLVSVLPGLSLAAYGLGIYRLWGQSRIGAGVSIVRAVGFASGMLCILIALSPQVDRYVEAHLSAHMAQHLALLLIAPPLLVLGAPMAAFLWALPARFRPWAGKLVRRTERRHSPWHYALWQPLIVWTLYIGALTIWHFPSFYEAALGNRWIHDFQHVTFVATALLFWRALLDPFSRLRVNGGIGVVTVFATSLHGGLLGVLMTFSPRVWYGWYAEGAGASPALQDQQLAGLLMWMPAGIVYAILAVLVFYRWVDAKRTFRLSEGGGDGV